MTRFRLSVQPIGQRSCTKSTTGLSSFGPDIDIIDLSLRSLAHALGLAAWSNTKSCTNDRRPRRNEHGNRRRRITFRSATSVSPSRGTPQRRSTAVPYHRTWKPTSARQRWILYHFRVGDLSLLNIYKFYATNTTWYLSLTKGTLIS